MNKYNYTMTIASKTEKEAMEKMAALSILASNLSGRELTKLAHTVQNEPAKTALAKTYLGL
jgi:hypothetical protein